MVAGPLSGSFRLGRTSRTMVKSVLFLSMLAGVCTSSVSAQLLTDQETVQSVCQLLACIGWCECTGNEVNVSHFRNDILFPPGAAKHCSLIPGFQAYDTCRNDQYTAVIAQTFQDNVRNCAWTRNNPLIFVKNDTFAGGNALRLWEGSDSSTYHLVKEVCVPQCNRRCGITLPPTTPPAPPTTMQMNTRKIDDILPRYTVTPEPTGQSGGNLSPRDIKLLGIAIGCFVAGLLICLMVVICCIRNRRRRRPKLPPRGPINQANENMDYMTIEEMQMAPVTTPNGVARAYPNLMYRSESLSALNQFTEDTSFDRSVSDFEMLGEPPQPPLRQLTLLPGVNPALADAHDGPSAPIDKYGYTKYLPDQEPPGLPYMHLKVIPTMSAPSSHSRRAAKPHRYRSNTTDTHANAEDVDRALKRIRAREAIRDGANRRFVPNNSGRNSGLGDEYNRVNRIGHRAVPRTQKQGNAFTPVPVYGQYHSRASIRKWKSLPDMTNDRQPDLTLPYNNPEDGNPVYHLLESSPASSNGDYSRRQTKEYQEFAHRNGVEQNSSSLPIDKSRENPGRAPRAASESAPSTYRDPGQTDSLGDRYDPVYEPSIHNDVRVPVPSGEYQALMVNNHGHHNPDFDDEAYQGGKELSDGNDYLKPTARSHDARNNGIAPTKRVSNGNRVTNKPDKKSYIYGSDNNNLTPKTIPVRTTGGNSYAALKLQQIDVPCDMDDDMENGEYMFQPVDGDMDMVA